MNVYDTIKTTLLDMDCSWSESNGIVTVVTPKGHLWDFTIPTEAKETYIVNREEEGLT